MSDHKRTQKQRKKANHWQNEQQQPSNNEAIKLGKTEYQKQKARIFLGPVNPEKDTCE